ncbi:MAG: hypothetical protein ACK53Y_19560 [bacterium]
MVADLTTITFVSDHPDDLKTGIQPFIAMDGSEEYRLVAQNMDFHSPRSIESAEGPSGSSTNLF